MSSEWFGTLVILTCVIILQFGPLNFFNPKKVLASNDGPLGFMNSGSMVDAGPGVGYWNDLNWLGSNGGVFPISPSYAIIWLLRGFNWMLVPSVLFLIWSFRRMIKR
jgi:hypothetical protein